MRTLFKGLGILIAGIILVLFVALASIYFITEARINKIYEVSVSSINIPDQPELGERKYPLVVVDFCRDCHGQDLSGQIMEDNLLLGRLVSANLTSGKGGIGSTYTPEDWVRTLRHGIGRDNKTLVAMPSNELNRLSDEDMGTIIRLIKDSPPVDHVLPRTRLGPMGRIFILQNIPLLTAELIEPNQKAPSMPQPGMTVEYGKYMAGLCTLCHGKDYSGSTQPGGGLNLTPAGNLANWTETDFLTAMRTGQTPEGKTLDRNMMPIGTFGMLTDDELKAIWLFLKTLPPVFTPTPVPAQ